MAVVVVGDIDVDAVEATVREQFSSLENPSPERERVEFGVPHHDDMLATIATDPEQPYTTVNVLFKHPRTPEGTVGSYRDGLLAGLFSGMINARFQEMTEKPDAPFRFAATGPNSFVRGTNMFLAFAVTKEDEVERGLRGLLIEIARIRTHGFTEGEFDRAKARVETAMEKAYNERDKTESGGLAAEYIRNFLEDEPIPGIEVEYELVGSLLPSMTLAEVNALVDELIHEDNTVISVSAPDKEGLVMPTGTALLAAAVEASAATPSAYEDAPVAAALMAELPEPGTVRSRRDIPELGVTEVVLSNGVKVWFKPTDFKNDEIMFSGIARGGLSLVDRDKYRSASLFSSILGVTGYGGHTPTELGKMLAGKIASASISLSDFSQGVSGGARPQDLETALQLTHLVLTQPNRDPELFQVFQEQLRVFLANRDSRPETRYTDKLLEVNYQGHYMRTPLTLDGLAEVDLDTAFDVFRERMADASDLEFFFVGAIDVETAVPLVARYLGSLPSLEDGPSDIGDPGLTFPDGVITETVRAGMEPKANTRITWRARASMDEMEMFRMRLATDILEIRLREILREELGSTYSVGVGYRYTPPYRGYAATVVSFGSAPENVDRMVAVVFEQVAKFKEEGPTPEEVAKVQELERRSVETGLKQNGYWLGSFVSLRLLGWDADRVLHRLDRIDTLTPKNLQDDFRLYFPEDNHTTISLLPENEDGPAGGDTGSR